MRSESVSQIVAKGFNDAVRGAGIDRVRMVPEVFRGREVRLDLLDERRETVLASWILEPGEPREFLPDA